MNSWGVVRFKCDSKRIVKRYLNPDFEQNKEALPKELLQRCFCQALLVVMRIKPPGAKIATNYSANLANSLSQKNINWFQVIVDVFLFPRIIRVGYNIFDRCCKV